MDRVVGIETEYGCLVSGEQGRGHRDAWPARVKNYLFREGRGGRDRPALSRLRGTAGQRRLSAERRPALHRHGAPRILLAGVPHLRDVVAYDLAGDLLLQSALEALGVADRVSFIKNNVDHHTGATFGCHENYLMKRELQFTPRLLGTLLSFLATRQIFTGAGRVGQASPLAFDFELPQPEAQVDFQLSQRADHIVNDIYQWVQFNRAIINARDEPLADYRKYRRLHLLIGDSNMSPFATALKVGTTASSSPCSKRATCPTTHPARCRPGTREISHDPTERLVVRLEDGKTIGALDIQWQFPRWPSNISAARRRDRLDPRELGLHARSAGQQTGTAHRRRRLDFQEMAARNLPRNRGAELGRSVAAKPRPRISQHQSREGPLLRVTPAKGIGEFNNSVRRNEAANHPPANTRAAGRAQAVAWFQKSEQPYVINWDSIACDSRDFLVMGDPFEDYTAEVAKFLAHPRPPRPVGTGQPSIMEEGGN